MKRDGSNVTPLTGTAGRGDTRPAWGTAATVTQ